MLSKKLIIISGATATGKSNLASKIASSNNNFAIINADALQIYKDLPILSAQPDFNDKNLNYFLYSILSIEEKISVAIWLQKVAAALETIKNNQQIPIIVGGSGMYISRLIDGIAFIPNIDSDNIKKSQEIYEKIGHQEFQKIYGTAKIIDRQKLLRRAQIFLQTGKNIDYFLAQKNQNIIEDYDVLHINLNLAREKIYQNCHDRFLYMLENKVIEEVENCISNAKFSLDLPIVKTLGFLEIYDFIHHKITKEHMIQLATQKTRNYAKRQLTWFRHQFKNINFCLDINDGDNLIKKFLAK